MSARTFAVFIGVLALIGLLAFGLAKKSTDQTLATGEPIPDAELPVLGEEEATGSIADYRGKWVLVNVWASWCGPCREEAPALERFYRRHRGERFTVLGIDTQDNSDDGLAFVRDYGLTYPNLHDGSGERHEALDMTGVPESVLVDPQGDVAYHQPGPFTERTLREIVEPRIGARA